MAHLAATFTIAHPGVTDAIIGPRTMDHLDGLSPPWWRWPTGWESRPASPRERSRRSSSAALTGSIAQVKAKDQQFGGQCPNR